jgi:hypothetical protein
MERGFMKRYVLPFSVCLVFILSLVIQGHDVITTRITYDREISRIVYERCASCHHPDGPAFSLMTYAEARPWAVAIKEEALSRRMPPWGAVKGFGEFRNDQGLTIEQLEMITSWVEGGVPEGEAKDLPMPPKSTDDAKLAPAEGSIAVSGDFKLDHPFLLDGLLPQKIADNESIQITAELPDGTVEPLLWLYEYKNQYAHPFLLQKPMELPAGTVIRGVPSEASILLLRASSLPVESGE